jgi:dCMP deaminase
MTPPREVVCWDEYFLGIAHEVATRSKDPNTQHGAVVVGPSRTIVSTGYNGPPSWVNDNKMDWGRPQKYPLIRHAEQNAMQLSGRAFLDDCVIYVTGKPCKMCYLEMVARRVRAVVHGAVRSAMCTSDDWADVCHIESLCDRKKTVIFSQKIDPQTALYFGWNL